MNAIPPPSPAPKTGPRYWRSLEELAETPEFRQWVENEFPAGATEFADPVTRRHFMKIMSASFLLAGFGLTGCRRPESNILPFSKQPEGYVHGVPQYYATAMPTRGGAMPLVVKSHEGRPTKVEGNALHPDSNGSTDRFAQASVLDLYDPDRAMQYKQGGKVVPPAAALDFLTGLSRQLGAKGGAGLCCLMERSSSPSRARLQKLVAERLPKAKWFIHEPVDFDIHREGTTLAFGKPVKPYYRLEQAKRIVSLDCDFLGAEEDLHRLIRDFAKGRRVESPDKAQGEDLMSRLYVVESLLTLTGASADHRLRVPPSLVFPIAAALAAALATEGVPQGGKELTAALGAAGVDPKWITECAKDLQAHKGNCVVLAGQRQPLAMHALAHAMNAALGNVGKTVVLHEAPAPTEGNIAELAQALDAGQVETLVVLGGNPVYNAPADLDWAATQRKAKLVVRLGYHEDETQAVSDWGIPRLHYLESWGDARTSDGTLVPIQPLIAPLFGGLTEVELLARLGGLEPASGYEIVRETFRGLTGGGEEEWKRFLHNGFQEGSAAKAVDVVLSSEAVNSALQAVKPPGELKDLEVVFHSHYCVDDGRYNNNGWMQELPEPITKVTWENLVLLSPRTFENLGLVSRVVSGGATKVSLVKVALGGREVVGPAWIQPGMADDVVGLALGYGRPRSGRVGSGAGYDAYRLRASAAPHSAPGATVAATGKLHPVATVQTHWAMEGRPVVREANLAQYLAHPEFAREMGPAHPPSTQPLYPNPFDEAKKRGLHQWGMAIDLNGCVGCSACVVACQSENNIPIVGKDQVSRSREMHWLRIDRYYAGPVEAPQVAWQALMCQHCEAAPCENVCPVNATSHDEEGLNVMTYNRCVGTRYCSNNCPYKVRRFNFFDYNKRPLERLKGPFYSTPMLSRTEGQWDLLRWFRDQEASPRPAEEWELLKLAKNPDVTVRMRGVMEKCTFCVQRIQQAQIAQKVKARDSGNVEVPEGTFKTACQQACPAEAIVFGNLKDENSRVSQLKRQERDYALLEFLGTKPRTTYLARVRNPNPAMPDYRPHPASWEEYAQHRGSHGQHEAKHGQPAGAQAKEAQHGH
ncbi:MAG TPA: TAT-variant-translocated molybdopterin oxidoreductase [Candidatus Paceibacterota bacterium]|nr:TAT-variant-translocated molybdopterin oxidoreductase [Verrucomicrobiota bacterium]HSA09248.1 TAT-variant-translocated molybdopterin oxidoreductase [Candidatus Paceibacterota bacterium]